MIVLVTGGAGFIGLNLLNRLLQGTDCDVRIFDNFSNSLPERVDHVVAEKAGWARRVRVIRGDITNARSVKNAIAGVDAVVHLAAQTGVGSSLAEPRRDLELNVLGTFNALEACRAAKVRRFVFASSAATLGNASPPQREDMPSRPISPYGCSKVAGEAYCSAFHHSFGIETVALRFSNVYGPRSWNKGSVIAQFAKRVLSGQPLLINGDGKQTRDFLHVEDLAEILVSAVTMPLGAALLGTPCNVATGVQTQIAELGRIFRIVFTERGRECSIEYAPPLSGDVMVSAPATDRVRQFFPRASFRTLTAGLPATIDWFLENWSPDARPSTSGLSAAG